MNHPPGGSEKSVTEKDVQQAETITVKQIDIPVNISEESDDAEDIHKDESIQKDIKPTDSTVSSIKAWKEKREKKRIEKETPENAKAGFKQWNKQAKSIKNRSLIVLVLTVIAIYFSCSAHSFLPVPAAISYASSSQIFYAVLIALALAALAVSWDIVKDAFLSISHLQIDFSTLTVLTVISTIVHSAVKIKYSGEETAYTCVAMTALFFLLKAREAQAQARRNTYKAAMLNKTPVGVYIHKGKVPHILKKRMPDSNSFVYSAACDGWHSRFERLYSPIAIVSSAVLAVIVSVASKDYERFIYTFSALLVASCQIGVLTAVSYGCVNSTRRLGADHAAVAGLSSAVRMADVPQAVMTEEDLFPAGSIHVDDYIDIRNAMTVDEVLACASALEGNSAIGKVLAEKLRRRYADSVAAHDIIHYSNGNQGRIGNKDVLFGTAELMQEKNITIPALPDEQDHMFLAVDGKTAAVFEVIYSAATQVYTAMQTFSDRKISILLQEGDCYLKDEQLCDLFGLKPGTIHRAGAEQSHAMLEPDYTKDDDLLAILTRDGAAPYADCADISCSLSRLTSIGMLLGIIAAVIDMLLMSYLCFVFAPLSASPFRVLLYSILWAIPVFFVENEAKKG